MGSAVVAPQELESIAALQVALRFETHLVIGDGQVKRRDGDQYGIVFVSGCGQGTFHIEHN